MAKAKDSAPPEKLLTEVELELMNILWKLGEGGVSEVIESLPKERDLAYTSVSTILRILEQKKIVTTRKEGRGHVYIPLLKKSDYEAKSVRHMVDKVFDGAPVALVSTLVRQLLESKDVDETELAQIRELLAKATRK
jgi:predicted transcriptional regulator